MFNFKRGEYHPSPLLRAVQIVLLVLIVLGIGLLLSRDTWVPKVVQYILNDSVVKYDPLNISYMVDGQSFTLANGNASKEIARDSATRNTLSVFGEPTYGDIDGDGDNDALLILVNNSGGSGTFYYATIAVNNGGVFTSTDSILLGDRIAPQTFAIRDGVGEVNYADRLSNESFLVPPSVGKTLRLKVDSRTNLLKQIAVNFEGEANPAIMTLPMQTWKWIKTTYKNGTELIPKTSGKFTITFKDDSFSATTDCNTMGGSYTKQDSKINFTNMMSTKMFCEGSQETEFSGMLADVESFSFTSKGELLFTLKAGTGTSTFR